MTHGLRVAGTGLVSMGVGLLMFVIITIVWGDPFTAATASNAQKDLTRQLTAAEAQFGGSSDAGARAPDPRLTRADAAAYRRTLKRSDAAGRVNIPKIGLRTVVVHGTDVPDLKKGPGLYPEAGFPGMGRPVGLAGHRTTYGAPFLDVDKLKSGDEIVVDMPYGRFVYLVSRTKIIEPTDWSILQTGAWQPRGTQGECPAGNCEHLVLTACHPKYSAEQRIAVFARLDSVTPRS